MVLSASRTGAALRWILEPGSIAAVLVYENSWAGPFASSIRQSGGQLVASGRIPTQALLAAIDADAQTQTQGT